MMTGVNQVKISPLLVAQFAEVRMRVTGTIVSKQSRNCRL